MKQVFARVMSMAMALVVTFALTPAIASAATSVSVRTVELLPPGGTACIQMTVTSVTPYLYNGALNSFDIAIPDPTYVAIGGSVGQAIIPLNYMTRTRTPDGQLLVHVDTASTPAGSSLPISVTLLSAHDGLTCATTVSFSVNSSGDISPVATTPSTPQPSPSVSQDHNAGTSNRGGGAGARPSHRNGTHSTHPTAAASSTASSTATMTVTAPTVATFAMCTSPHDFQLWFVLLALFVIIAAFAALTRPSLALRNPAIPVALILVPLIFLVGFWYFVPGCRAATWIPIVLLIIAIIALLVAFRDQKGGPMLLPTGSPQTPPKPTPASPETVKAMPAEKKAPTPAAVNAAQKFAAAKAPQTPQKPPVPPPQVSEQKPQQGSQQNGQPKK